MKKTFCQFVNTLSISSLILISIILTSCGDDNPTTVNTATVNGTLTLLAEANGRPYSVFIDNDTNGGNGYIRITTGTCGAGTEVNYSITNVPSGTYYAYAVVFVVSDGTHEPQSGDYYGFYNPGGSSDTPPNEPNAVVTSEDTVTFDITLVVMP